MNPTFKRDLEDPGNNGAFKLPPSAVRQLNEIISKNSALDLNKVAREAGILDKFKLDPALMKKIAPGGVLGPELMKKFEVLTRNYGKMRPLPRAAISPPVRVPTPVVVTRPIEVESQPKPVINWGAVGAIGTVVGIVVAIILDRL